MKILMITTYVTLEGRKEFERSKTGFGYMVYDIARAVAATEEVDLFAAWSRGKGFTNKGIHFLPRTIWLFMCYIFHCVGIKNAFRVLKKYTKSKGTRIRFIYCWLLTGYLDKIIRDGNYDIVHIHGCSPLNDLWMEICRRNDVKFIVTLHGLDSFSDSVKLEAPGKQYERDLLQRVADGAFPISVISTGIKRVFEKCFNVNALPNVFVVCNSFRFKDDNISTLLSVRDQYDIPEDGKILLYVGNVSYNKNQRQMVETFGLLPNDVKKNTWVLFCGNPSQDGSFEELAKSSPFSNHLVLCGTVKKSDIVNYYKVADGVALLSKAEGFGLSLVEGMHFGVPCAMFSDMDAFDDIYNPCAVVAINERDNESVTNGILQLLQGSWDKDRIKQYSKKFESQSMANDYINTYKRIVD